MADNTKRQGENNLDQIEGALGKSEQFFEKNQKLIVGGFAVIIVVVLAIFGTQKLFIQPKEAAAQVEIYKAQELFKDSKFEEALNGDGATYLGFLEIADQYKITKSGKLANYYIGVSYLRLGDFQNAVNYLSKYKSNDYYIGAMAKSALGDAYVELGNYPSAIGAYKQACSINPNDLTTPEFLKKLAMAYELSGDNSSAIATYEEIVDKYPTSTAKIDANRSLGRLQK